MAIILAPYLMACLMHRFCRLSNNYLDIKCKLVIKRLELCSVFAAATEIRYQMSHCEMVMSSASQTDKFPGGNPASSQTKITQMETLFRKISTV